MRKEKGEFKREKKIFRAVVVSVIFALVTVTIFSVSYFASAGYVMYREALSVESLEDKVKRIQADESYVTLSELPRVYKEGVVNVEDKRFYSHNGIDPISVARAVLRNIQNMSLASGGSTITQQLAKNLFFTFEKRFERKAAEVFMVNLIEKTYDKDEILELYVNVIDFGLDYTGISEASKGYYGKDPIELDIYECATLIAVPNAPQCYSPVLSPEESKVRQGEIIEQLTKNGIITEDDYIKDNK